MEKRWSRKYDCCQNPDHDFYKGGDSPHMAHGNCYVCYHRDYMNKRNKTIRLKLNGKVIGKQ